MGGAEWTTVDAVSRDDEVSGIHGTGESKSIGSGSKQILLVGCSLRLEERITRVTADLSTRIDVSATSCGEALRLVEHGAAVLVVASVDNPDATCLRLLQRARDVRPATPLVATGSSREVETIVDWMRRGASDFVEEAAPDDRLRQVLERALELVRIPGVAQSPPGSPPREQRLLGDSPVMRWLRRLITKVGPTDGRVLLLGENGTGKELVATSIHAASRRRAGPFIKLNCGAVPKDLIETELFGHEKGAFTGAVSSRRGRFELAHDGTLFLDEIGDMPPAMQVKVLRVLQDGEFERVGGSRTLWTNARVIAATNKDLTSLVDRGLFREDLYFRLAVVTIVTPPLRERREDIPLLVRHFAECSALRSHRPPLVFTPEALEHIQELEFRGNVRELENLVDRLTILDECGVIAVDDLIRLRESPVGRRSESPSLYREGVPLRTLVRDAEAAIIEAALAAHGNSKLQAARALGLERSNFYRKCRHLEARRRGGGSG